MRILRNISIRGKITAIIMITSISLMLSIYTLFTLYELFSYRFVMTEYTRFMVEFLGMNCTRALTTGNQKAAEELLASLKVDPEVISVFIFTKKECV